MNQNKSNIFLLGKYYFYKSCIFFFPAPTMCYNTEARQNKWIKTLMYHRIFFTLSSASFFMSLKNENGPISKYIKTLPLLGCYFYYIAYSLKHIFLYSPFSF